MSRSGLEFGLGPLAVGGRARRITGVLSERLNVDADPPKVRPDRSPITSFRLLTSQSPSLGESIPVHPPLVKTYPQNPWEPNRFAGRLR